MRILAEHSDDPDARQKLNELKNDTEKDEKEDGTEDLVKRSPHLF